MTTIGQFVLVILPIIGAIIVVILTHTVTSTKFDVFLVLLGALDLIGGFIISLIAIWHLATWHGVAKLIASIVITIIAVLIMLAGTGGFVFGKSEEEEYQYKYGG